METVGAKYREKFLPGMAERQTDRQKHIEKQTDRQKQVERQTGRQIVKVRTKKKK